MKKIIEINNFSFKYKGEVSYAIKNINLDVFEGEVLGIIGPNKSGKSTLCFAISGIIPHFYQGEYLGKISLFDKDPKILSLGELSKFIGLVTQNPVNQISGIKSTVFDEISFSLENLGVPRELIKEKVEYIAKLTGLFPLLDQSPYHLSGGEQQKMVIACMLVKDSPIFILDEPVSLLDPKGRKMIMELLSTLIKQGKTILITEHNLELIASYANRTILINEGEIIEQGHSNQVLTSKSLLEVGLSHTRYTQSAILANNKFAKDTHANLPVTLSQTLTFFNNFKREKNNDD